MAPTVLDLPADQTVEERIKFCDDAIKMKKVRNILCDIERNDTYFGGTISQITYFGGKISFRGKFSF